MANWAKRQGGEAMADLMAALAPEIGTQAWEILIA
jgi:hypothetical protein